MSKLSRRAMIAASAAGVAMATRTGTCGPQDNERKRHESRQEWLGLYTNLYYRKAQEKRLSSVIKKFATAFHPLPTIPVEADPSQADHIPRCCVFFEIIGHLGPGPGSWVFIHDTGGSLCLATDDEQMAAAVDHLIQLTKGREVPRQLPKGVTTSLPVHRVA